MDDTDRRDAVIVRWVPAQGPPRRYRFEPRSDDTYERVEEWWNGCTWIPTGRELVEAVHVVDPDAPTET